MNLECYRLHDDVTIPQIATLGSACFDVHAYIHPNNPVTVYNMENKKIKREPEWYDKEQSPKVRLVVEPGDRVLVPTGIIFKIPHGVSLRLHTRSSNSLKKGLIMPNGEGIIDSDYYHETFIMLYNSSADEVRIKHGERIAQGELIKTLDYSLEESIIVPEQKTNRVGGFGSTGTE